MKKLFVGNIPHTTTEAELRTLFEPHGAIQQVSIVTERDTGRSRGFAFVEMTDSGEAEKARRGGYSSSKHISDGLAVPRRSPWGTPEGVGLSRIVGRSRSADLAATQLKLRRGRRNSPNHPRLAATPGQSRSAVARNPPVRSG